MIDIIAVTERVQSYVCWLMLSLLRFPL